jgi:transketolase
MDLFVVDQHHYQRQDGTSDRTLRTLCAFNRINALSCIKSAEHGWIGASYSITELLTVLYFRYSLENVVLSKGHAAAMQYACLFGRARIDRQMLLSYQNGPGSLQAHTDHSTPGILTNTGSLGQGLSKTAGLAIYQPNQRFAVILGDGELQEGQVFEAFQTVAQRKLANVTAILDLNGFQSELSVDTIKGIADYRRLFAGLGLSVLDIEGHDVAAVAKAWKKSAGRPTVILAHTIKAGGSSYLAPRDGKQPWHGLVPDDELYVKIVAEQVERAADGAVQAEFETYRQRVHPQPKPAQAIGSTPLATRDAYSQWLVSNLDRHPELVVLDADLVHSCGLDALVGHPRFLEMGISEQDMVSFAGGLALYGKLPVVNTYATFYKRALDQLFVNATEGTKIIYVGHYAGLCYFADGKTHQSINDLALMSAVPGLTILEPVTTEQTHAFLEWATGSQPHPTYLRLRRTPMSLEIPNQPLLIDRPLVMGDDFSRCFITTGTVSTRLAFDCMHTADFKGFGLMVQGVFHGPLDRDFYRERLASTERIITIEEDTAPGTLRSFVHDLTQELGLRPRIVSKCIEGLGASFRTLDACLNHFGFTVEKVKQQLLSR